MAQFYGTFFLIAMVSIVYSTAIVEYVTLGSLLADKIFEMKVRDDSTNETLLGGQTTSFRNRCSAAVARSRFITERKVCQSYQVINFDRCRIPTLIYTTRCCATQVNMNTSLQCREVFYNVQVLQSNSCNSNNLKDYHKSIITIPVSCVCVLPRSLPEPPL